MILTLRSEVLRDHLSLLCNSELAINGLGRVGKHSTVQSGVASSAYRTAFTVEEGELHAVLLGYFNHFLLTLILSPACRKSAGIFG
jgi:hypothetical protein